MERVHSGIYGLDEVIEGGFPRGSLIIVAGNPGTGKTVFQHNLFIVELLIIMKKVFMLLL
ncbi:MAG: hypothetical protein HA493_05185 [Candidatus Verstraetearchaeota archaeon]|nr:hypothetical protein [Candidatus Verstraetearchaeota archaeon]